MRTLTYAITHSPVFVRSLGHRPIDETAEALRQELLHGVAAQDAFVALFDACEEFDDLAWEATQAPVARETARRPRGQRGAAARLPRAAARVRDAVERAPAPVPGPAYRAPR